MRVTRRFTVKALLGAVALALTGLHFGSTVNAAPPGHAAAGKVVVADRNSGTISVISVHTDEVVATVALPEGDATPEPMYVYYTPIMNRVFVGDRANSRVVAFDARTFEVDGIVPAGQGVFHMWGNSATRELWVNNDIDNTTTVIDMRTLEVLATVPTPADLVADGGKPHDVILSPTGLFAYVTVIGVAGDNDYVVQYFTPTRMEMNRTAVGKDVHVSLSNQNEKLFVPCQNTSNVYVLNQVSLNVMDIIDVPGAHGAGMPKNGRYFYTTNLPGGGTDGLFTIDTRTHELVGEPTDTPYTVPHNIALTSNGRKLYLTHSGATNDKVTVYRTTPQHPAPELIGEVTVGMNPFGLAYVP